MAKWIYTKSVPKELYVACSGGVDSVAAAAILSEWRNVTLVHFDHNDLASEHELEIVHNLSKQLSVPLLTEKSTDPAATNKEATWRNARYQWFHSLPGPVATAHTTDDLLEWYLITCLRGEGHVMPISNRNVFRPFLKTDKLSLIEYAVANYLQWWDDPGNCDIEFSLRSKVRNVLVPSALQCEPGLKNMLKRRLDEKLRLGIDN